MNWIGSGRGRKGSPATPALLDRYIPRPDVTERHGITIKAPPDIVLDVARGFDMQSIPLVRAIIWLRARMLGARGAPVRPATGLVPEMLALGWGPLEDVPGRWFVAGASCRPWHADVVFTPIPPHQFATFSAPDRVKIAWTLEARPLDSGTTRFVTETRAVATDEVARVKFRRYWSRFGIGVAAIRWLMLPALRREAERRRRHDREGLGGPASPTPTRDRGVALTPKEMPHER